MDLEGNKVGVGGRELPVQISGMDREIIKVGGIEKAFERFGRRLFEVLYEPSSIRRNQLVVECGGTKEL